MGPILGLEYVYTCWHWIFWSSGNASALYSEVPVWNIGRKISCPSWGSWCFFSNPPGQCCQLGPIAFKRRPGIPVCVFFLRDQLEMYHCVLWIHPHASNQDSSVSTMTRLHAGGRRNRGWIPRVGKSSFCRPKRADWPWELVVWSREDRRFIFLAEFKNLWNCMPL